MANLTGTGIIKNITPIGGGKYRISFVEDTFTGINIPSAQVISYQTYANSPVLMDPYISTPNFTYSDFNAVINNALIPRQSNIFWDLDYSTNAIQAVNQQVIISASQQNGNLPKAFIQDYNYYSTPILRRNYLGAKSTSPNFNEPASAGGFGQLPVVQSEGYYFAYFNWVGGTSPEWGNGLEDRSAVNVRYYIGEEGNVIEPINDSDGINLSIVQQGFEQDSNAILSFNDKEGATSKFANLEGKHKIFKSGQIPQPIIYSQTESISNTTPGGFTGSLEFVQGDQQESSTIGSYRLKAFTNSSIITQESTVSFSTPVTLGDSGSFTSNVYEPTVTNPSSTSPATTLTFEAYLETDISNLNGSSATFFIQKNSDGAGWVDVSSNIGNVLEPGVVNNITLTYTDSNALTTDDYRLQITSAQLGGLGQFTSINTNSYFKVNQSPPPNIGLIGPDVSATSTNYWEKTAVITNKFRTNALTAVLGQRQKDISNSGFNPITFDFDLQIGDEIRFQGTETQTYTIVNITNATVVTGAIVYTVDRNINLTNTEMNWFLVRRYVNDPSYLILEVDKPAGGTSTGVITPEYFYGATEEKVDNILKELKKDNLI